MHILFVCLGNICRSPTAEAVFRSKAAAAGLSGVGIDSAGTGDWYIGHPPDRRAIAAARKRGYALAGLRARQVEASDFHRFTHIMAMDRQNLEDLQRMAPAGHTARLELFPGPSGRDADVPDPYFGGPDGFERTLDLIEAGCDVLIGRLQDGQAARL